MHVLLRSANPLLVADDDEDVDDIIDLGVSGGGGLEDMADYAHAIVGRRCAVIMRNVSCDAPSAEAAMAWPHLMPMFQLMTEHISTMVHAADSIEHGQLAVRVRRRRLCMVVNRGVCARARVVLCAHPVVLQIAARRLMTQRWPSPTLLCDLECQLYPIACRHSSLSPSWARNRHRS